MTKANKGYWIGVGIGSGIVMAALLLFAINPIGGAALALIVTAATIITKFSVGCFLLHVGCWPLMAGFAYASEGSKQEDYYNSRRRETNDSQNNSGLFLKYIPFLFLVPGLVGLLGAAIGAIIDCVIEEKAHCKPLTTSSTKTLLESTPPSTENPSTAPTATLPADIQPSAVIEVSEKPLEKIDERLDELPAHAHRF